MSNALHLKIFHQSPISEFFDRLIARIIHEEKNGARVKAQGLSSFAPCGF